MKAKIYYDNMAPEAEPGRAAPHHTGIINKSLSCDTVPSDFKRAHVRSLLKKAWFGLRNLERKLYTGLESAFFIQNAWKGCCIVNRSTPGYQRFAREITISIPQIAFYWNCPYESTEWLIAITRSGIYNCHHIPWCVGSVRHNRSRRTA